MIPLIEKDYSRLLEGERPRLIDEWQEYPAVWDGARIAVDDWPGKGQFIFTGSHAAPRGSVRHSGAGRVGKLKMTTMSLYESGDSSGVASLRDILDNKFDYQESPGKSIPEIADIIFRGGWPDVVFGPNEPINVPYSYLDNVLVKMAEVSEPFPMKRATELLRSLARNESQPVSDRKIGEDTFKASSKRMSQPTIGKYLTLFRRFYLLDPVPPIDFNLRTSDKVLERDKMRFFDPAFACAILGIESGAELLRDVRTLGLMFESLCLRDLSIYAQALGGKLHYYRNMRGEEIDAVVKMRDGSWIAAEIKLGSDTIDETAARLVRLKEKITEEASKPKAMMIIVASGSAAYKRADDVYVVPITALKP